VEVGEDLEAAFDNMQLLRMQLFESAEEFKRRNAKKYPSEQDLDIAARRYANAKHREEGNQVWVLHLDAIGVKQKDI
jgi:hypothetical protein